MVRFRLAFALASIMASCVVVFAGPDDGQSILSRATQIFGQQFNVEGHAFPLGDKYAIWLFIDTKGDFWWAMVRPKSANPYVFRETRGIQQEEYISQTDYE